MKELLQNKGFYMYHSCTCGGEYNEGWRNDNIQGIEIKLIPGRDSFQIKQYGNIIEKGNSSSFQVSLEKINQTV